jgi:hypothetical protein
MARFLGIVEHLPGRVASTLSAALRFAPTPFRAHGLDRLSVEPKEGTYVMADKDEERLRRSDRAARHRVGFAWNVSSIVHSESVFSRRRLRNLLQSRHLQRSRGVRYEPHASLVGSVNNI